MAQAYVRRTEEDKVFCAHIEDLVYQMQKSCIPCFSRFLDEREQALAESVLRQNKITQDQYYFWTGFAVSEENAMGRRMLGIFPEYLSASNGIEPAVWEEQFPIEAVTLSYHERDELTHRDILGSCMGLGMKRELLGEILTGGDFAVIFCTPTAREMILSELEQVGRVKVAKCGGIPPKLPPMYRLEYKTGTVSSLRLDCVVALAVNLSREKSAALIESGSVNLNFFEETKISKEISQGDILSLRGYGRFVLSEVGAQSKKGRIHITIGKYV